MHNESHNVHKVFNNYNQAKISPVNDDNNYQLLIGIEYINIYHVLNNGHNKKATVSANI